MASRLISENSEDPRGCAKRKKARPRGDKDEAIRSLPPTNPASRQDFRRLPQQQAAIYDHYQLSQSDQFC
jgi:hypothetical protein